MALSRIFNRFHPWFKARLVGGFPRPDTYQRTMIMAKKKTAKKAGSAKKTGSKKAGKPALDATRVADQCAAGHQWDADGDGEFCTICRADKKVAEKEVRFKKTDRGHFAAT
jgi:hypothetical protein